MWKSNKCAVHYESTVVSMQLNSFINGLFSFLSNLINMGMAFNIIHLYAMNFFVLFWIRNYKLIWSFLLTGFYRESKLIEQILFRKAQRRKMHTQKLQQLTMSFAEKLNKIKMCYLREFILYVCVWVREIQDLPSIFLFWNAIFSLITEFQWMNKNLSCVR